MGRGSAQKTARMTASSPRSTDTKRDEASRSICGGPTTRTVIGSLCAVRTRPLIMLLAVQTYSPWSSYVTLVMGSMRSSARTATATADADADEDAGSSLDAPSCDVRRWIHW